MDWQLLIYQQDATTLRATLTAADEVARLDSFTISPQGDCGDGVFTALPSAVAIEPRDIVVVEVDTTGSMEAIYKGVVTVCGNPRSDDAQAYRVVGIRQRMYEQVVLDASVTGGDVAAMVRQVLSNSSNLPAGVTYTATDVPDLGFELGNRYPAYETVGDFLDAMMATVGRFIVPSGSSYTYDGTTYAPGDVVPAVTWGVRADGSIYFRRPAATSAIAASELDARTLVTWNEINAEAAVTDNVLIYLAAFDLTHFIAVNWRSGSGDSAHNSSDPPTMVPVARWNGEAYTTAISGDDEALIQRAVVPNPLDYMLSAPGGTPAETGWNGTANTRDGDLATFNQQTTTSGLSELRVLNIPASDGLLRLRYSADGAGGTNALWQLAVRIKASSTDYVEMVYEVPDSAGGVTDLWLPVGVITDYSGTLPFTGAAAIDLWVRGGTSGFRIYEIQFWVPDGDLGGTAGALYAEGITRPIPSEVASVAYDGRGQLAAWMNLETTTGTITLPLERIEYGISTEQGITTTYYAGQAYPSDLETQRVILDRLARRAVAEGGRRR